MGPTFPVLSVRRPLTSYTEWKLHSEPSTKLALRNNCQSSFNPLGNPKNVALLMEGHQDSRADSNNDDVAAPWQQRILLSIHKTAQNGRPHETFLPVPVLAGLQSSSHHAISPKGASQPWKIRKPKLQTAMSTASSSPGRCRQHMGPRWKVRSEYLETTN